MSSTTLEDRYSYLQVASLDCIHIARLYLVSFIKLLFFGKKTLTTLSKKTIKLFNARHCTFGKFLENIWQVSYHSALRFYSNPSQQSAEGSQRHADALRGVNAGAERTPGTAHVPQNWQSFQPGQIRLGKVGAAAVCDDASAPAQNDAHVASTRASRPVSPALS